MKQSKTVKAAIADLYAIMATAAAKRAIVSISQCNSINAERDADFWAETTAKWLAKASADSVRWTYRKPSI